MYLNFAPIDFGPHIKIDHMRNIMINHYLSLYAPFYAHKEMIILGHLKILIGGIPGVPLLNFCETETKGFRVSNSIAVDSN